MNQRFIDICTDTVDFAVVCEVILWLWARKGKEEGKYAFMYIIYVTTHNCVVFILVLHRSKGVRLVRM